VKKQKREYLSIPKIPGQLYLWIAVIIFGASSAVTRKLTQIGAQHFIDGRNPISLCNVLFVGNLCALIVLLPIYARDWNKETLQKVLKKDWFLLTTIAILSGALAPALIFQALAITKVNNIILIGRLELPLSIALSVWLLRERVNVWQLLGAFFAFFGVILTVILQSPESSMINMGNFQIGIGEILTIFASFASVSSGIILRKYLAHISLGIFSIFRTVIGTIVFFFTALIIYGSHHFMDVFSPFLWKWMLVYSAIIVVLGQSFWFKGSRASTATSASLIASFSPVVGILAAYLVLGEAPTKAQYIGGSLVLFGVFLSQIVSFFNRRINSSIS